MVVWYFGILVQVFFVLYVGIFYCAPGSFFCVFWYIFFLILVDFSIDMCNNGLLVGVMWSISSRL